MHQVVIKGLVGIDYAEFEVRQLAVLAGLNRVGKTTIAQGIRAALTGRSLIRGVDKKGNAGVLVRGGASGAEVSVSSNGGQSSVLWPQCEVKTTGAKPPNASPIASGLVRFAELDERTRATHLTVLLQAMPKREDWVEHMLKGGVLATITAADKQEQPGPAAQLWDMIAKHGWDATHVMRVDAGKKYKAQWEVVTNANYGSKIGGSWLPNGWHNDLNTASQQSLGAAVAAAHEALEAELKKGAVAGDRIAQLRDKAANVDKLQRDRASAENAVTMAEKAKADAQRRIEGLQPVPSPTVPCPHCGKGIVVTMDAARGFNLESGVAYDARDIAILKENHKKADIEYRNAKDSADACQETLDRLESELEAAELAAEDLAVATRAAQTVDLEGARERLRIAQERLTMFEAKTKADALHRSIAGNEYAIKALAPEGLRAAKTGEAIKAFNDELTPIGEQWELPNLKLSTDGFLPHIGGRAYGVMAESEQWAVDAILQLAFAKIDKSSLVVIDRIDVLETALKQKVFRWLANHAKTTGLDVVVCGTWAAPGKAPALDGTGLGNSYWVGGATVRPLAVAQSKAA